MLFKIEVINTNISEENINNIMRQVMKEVDIAIKGGNSPFAAFLLDKNGNILYRAHNTSNTDIDPTAHAEINLIRMACSDLQSKDLSEYILVSNAWSCSMCFSAAIKAKISNFIFGVESESNMNPNVTIYDIKEKCKNEINIISGILKDECKKQIEDSRR